MKEKDKKEGVNRRGFLKIAAAAGAAFAIQPTLNKIKAANVALNGKDSSSIKAKSIAHRRSEERRVGKEG